MRRELTTVFAALATLITLAFVVPLGLSARDTARDRALDAGRATGSALVPVVAAGSPAAVGPAVDAANAPGQLQVSVVIANDVIGPPIASPARSEAAAAQTASFTGPADGGVELVTAVVGQDGTDVIRVLVPDQELGRGVLAAWAALAGVGLVLITVSVAVADRIAQRIVQPARALADAANRLGAGELEVAVTPSGPPELAETAAAFNHLTGQIRTMLAAEREMVSELTHRLRTPLTRLRIDLDRVADADLALDLHRAVDAVTEEVNGLIAQARRTVDPPRPIDVGAVVADRFEFWSVLAAEEERECNLVVSPDATATMVAVDPDELAAALDVLIENVFAHTPRGTGFDVAVERSTGDGADDDGADGDGADGDGADGGTDGGVTITVDDAGSGFNAALAAAGRSGGGSTGLGLAIVERLARASNGSVEITTSPRGGARIRCRLGGPGAP